MVADLSWACRFESCTMSSRASRLSLWLSASSSCRRPELAPVSCAEDWEEGCWETALRCVCSWAVNSAIFRSAAAFAATRSAVCDSRRATSSLRAALESGPGAGAAGAGAATARSLRSAVPLAISVRSEASLMFARARSPALSCAATVSRPSGLEPFSAASESQR